MGDKSHEAVKHITAVAEELEGYSFWFGITSQTDVFAANNIKEDGIYLFRNFDKSPVKYPHNSFAIVDIRFFIHDSALPSFVEFTPILPPRIFANMYPALYLVVSSKSDKYSSQKELAKKISEEYKTKLKVVFLDVEEPSNSGFLDHYLGFEKGDVPAMRLAHGIQDKFEPELGSFTEDTIKNYVDDRLGGEAVGWTKSEKLPEDWDKGNVKILVAKNFRDVVEKNKNVFVEFYAPWCGHCKKLEPDWERLGQRLKGRKDILIAKMDATVNLIDHYQ